MRPYRLLNLCTAHLTGSRRHIGHISAAAASTGASLSVPAVPAQDGAHARSSSGGRAMLLDGRAVAAAWEKELLADVQHLTELLGRPPGLGVVLVGNRPDSMLYVTKKQEACQKAGMQTFVHHLPESVSQAQLEAAVSHACADCRVDGVLIQLPLPRHLSEEAVMEVLDPRKDVDGFHPLNMGRMLMRGRGVRLVPATPLGCIELLQRSGVEVQGKTCVVLGDSNIVGTPLAAMLRDKGAAAVTICHRRSYREWFEDQEQVQCTRAAAAVCLPPLPGPSRPPPPDLLLPPLAASAPAEGGNLGGEASMNEGFQSYQLPYLTRSADILVVAAGHPELVRGDWVRPGAVVIDVGINVVSTLPRSRSSSTPETEGTTAAVALDADADTATAALAGRSSGNGGVHVAATEFVDRGSGCSAGGQGGSCSSNSSRSGGFGMGGYGGSAYGNRDASNSNISHVVNGNSDGWVATVNGCSLHSGRSVTFQVVGDVAFEEVSQVAGAITPVPGGVGPMTIAAVLHNTLKAAKYRVGLEPW
ncbi:hypothetical protein Vafri_1263 [Volvox africanus]|nr:hypothetical protein Vafri_1263 [Volvox africanus]